MGRLVESKRHSVGLNNGSIFLKLGFNALAIFSLMLGNVAFFIILARSLMPADFGEFVYYYSCASLLVLIVDFGFTQRVLKDYYGLSSKAKWAFSVRAVQYKSVAACIILLLSFLGLMLGFDAYFLGLVVASIFSSFGDYSSATLKAQGEYSIDALVLIVSNIILFLSIVFLCIYVSNTVVAGVSALMIGKFAYFFIATIISKNISKANIFLMPVLYFRGLRRIVSHHWSYAIDVAVTRSFGIVDTIIVNAVVGAAAVGLYQSGQRILQGILPMAQVLNNVFLPRISNRGNVKLKRDNLLFLLFTFLGAAGCTVAFSVFGEIIVSITFGDQYAAIYGYLPLIGFNGAIRFLCSWAAIRLTAAGRQRYRARANVISVLLLMIFMSLGGGFYGLSGVLYGALIANSMLFVFLVMGINLRRIL
ncbi:lipopolysaccharide biosynthesis protein [Zhongshania aquimaris]|uniref:Lipopolysaccharide biosynthesis protein n=1 Tax=Zhongshania aquimaris TaxID=2857107 RepID=A0ABS6VRD6_9GAMM|nr:lipopolysaccharide biosynthesis protein [Zhongshania aquimaris]MBW2940880.1 lipopolysaccharide biosynthesis protein [Zhongshania aquimaris]